MKMMPIAIYLAEKMVSFPRQRTTKDPDKLLSVTVGHKHTGERAKENEQRICGELK